MASLRFNFNGERRTEKTQNTRRMQNPLFLYPARYPVRRATAPGFYSVHRDTYEPETKQKTEQDINAEYNNSVGMSEDEQFVEEQNKNETVSAIDPFLNNEQEEKIYEQNEQNEQNEEQEFNVSEKIVAFLDSSEIGLNKAKGHVDNVRLLVEEVTFKLDSFMSILEIIYNSEDRRMKGPQATITSQKETKDTIDEILEMLQNPAFQSMLRQFMMSIIGKNKKN